MRDCAGGAVILAVGLLALSGCLPGISPFRGDGTADPDAPVQDPVNERWYVPSDVVDGTTMIHEQFPDLEVESGMSVAGQFTDPNDRVPLPAQDDYWRQSVMVVGTATVTGLIDEATAARASDGGGDTETLTGEGTEPTNAPAGTRAADEVISGTLVEPLEAEAGQCESDWILLGQTFTADPGDTIRPITADGLVITMAAVCEGGDRIVVDARQF